VSEACVDVLMHIVAKPHNVQVKRTGSQFFYIHLSTLPNIIAQLDDSPAFKFHPENMLGHHYKDVSGWKSSYLNDASPPSSAI